MTERMFTPKEDVRELLKDGGGFVTVARKGVPMTYTRAAMLGLVADGQDVIRTADAVLKAIDVSDNRR